MGVQVESVSQQGGIVQDHAQGSIVSHPSCCLGIMEKNMETTIKGLEFRV